MQRHVQEQVAEFLLQFPHVTPIQRFDHLIRLLKQTLPEGTMRLPSVPRTLLPQAPDDGNEPGEFFRWNGRKTVTGHGDAENVS